MDPHHMHIAGVPAAETSTTIPAVSTPMVRLPVSHTSAVPCASCTPQCASPHMSSVTDEHVYPLGFPPLFCPPTSVDMEQHKAP